MLVFMRGLAGRALYVGWTLRRRLAETKRPLLARALVGVAAPVALCVTAEGFLAARHASGEVARGKGPAARLERAGALWLSALGLTGLGAAGSVASRRRSGARAMSVFAWGLLASGVAMLGGGLRGDDGSLMAAGSVNLTAGSLLAALLGLAWYTLDPLGLHWPDRA